MALCLLLLAVGSSGHAAMRKPPPATPECSLNGAMSTDKARCDCDQGWTGEACGQLALLPAPALGSTVTPAAALSVDNSAANSTWGISVVGPIDSVFHGYMTEIANECQLGDYGIASQIVHMTAGSPLGPWAREGVVLAGFAHNPQAILTPNGSVILFHIGEEMPRRCLGDCRGTRPTHTSRGNITHPPKPRPESCPTPSHGASVAVAGSPEGPFRRFPYIFGERGFSQTNPAPLLLADGTLIVHLRRGTETSIPLFFGHVDRPGGPWVARPGRLHASPAVVATHDEDAFFWRTPRGYHMITHRAVTDPRYPPAPAPCGPPLGSALCGGGHLFSKDLRAWFSGESVYHRNASAMAQCLVTFEDGETVRFTSRQRPTMLLDDRGRRFLFNGASVNKSEYEHSFTFVQEISME